MREILFKAKPYDWKTNQSHNSWIEGFYLSRAETTYCVKEDYERHPVETLHFIAEECMTDWGLPNEFRLIRIDPETLCQYSGLTDKNKTKIFENDICTTDLFYAHKLVIFRNGCFMYQLNDGDKDYYDIMMPVDPLVTSDDYTEVICNLYDSDAIDKLNKIGYSNFSIADEKIKECIEQTKQDLINNGYDLEKLKKYVS